MRTWWCPVVAGLALWAGGCGHSMDYGPYLDHMPRSVVVLPPLNETAEVEVPDAFLSTITTPLAERGYYVYPVVLVDQFMKENGMPTAGEMHQVPPAKLREVFGADAVLYIVVKKWTTQYIVISSASIVEVEYRLVDAKTGIPLWRRQQRVENRSGGGGNPIGMLVSAAVHAAVQTAMKPYREMAVQANFMAMNDKDFGMLCGAYHPEYEKDQAERKEERAKRDKEAQGK